MSLMSLMSGMLSRPQLEFLEVLVVLDVMALVQAWSSISDFCRLAVHICGLSADGDLWALEVT